MTEKTTPPRQYKIGANADSGKFVCTSCGGEIQLKQPGRIPPCHRCSNSTFMQAEEAETMEIGSTGNYLRTLRLSKDLSIKNISEATRISETNINAIEDEDYAALPAKTFTRGLLKIYAGFLGANAEMIANKFMEEREAAVLSQKRKPRPKQSGRILTPKRLAEPAQISSITMAVLLFLAITISFTGYCVYTSWNPFSFLMEDKGDMQAPMGNVFQGSKPVAELPALTEPALPPAGPEPETASEIRSALEPAADPLAKQEIQSETKPDAVPEALPEAKQEATDKQAAAVEAETKADPAKESVQIPEGLPAQPAAAPEQPADRKESEAGKPNYTVDVHFLKDTSVRITTDNAKTILANFQPGDTQTWSARTSLEMTFAQPGSAEIVVNGHAIRFPPLRNNIYALKIPQDTVEPQPDE